MHKIKEKPEDFYVKEIIDLKFSENGRHFYYLLKKRDLNTSDAVNTLKKRFNADVGYCGNKDKNAVTEQYISLNKKIKDFKSNKFSVSFVGTGDKKLNLGDNIGNYFRIIARNFKGIVNKYDFIENYFDEQRFGKNNHIIGKNLIKKNFKEVCELLHLNVNNKDYISSIKRLDKKLLLIYIHAYQSYLFNEYLSRCLIKFKDYFSVDYRLGKLIFLKNKIKNFKIPLVSFDTKDIFYNRILKEEDVKLSDFIIKQFPELVNETVYRDAFADIKNLKLKNLKNEIVLEFELPKGSYATIAVRKLLNFS